jgi:hypothetical protein
MRFRRSPDLSKVPTETLLGELQSRGLFVATQTLGPDKVRVPNAELSALFATIREQMRSFVALVDKYGALCESEAKLHGELAAERALTAHLLRELGFDAALDELLEGDSI